MIYTVLQQLKTPQELPGLVRALGTTSALVEEALRQLESHGYVTRAYEGAPSCPSCGACSMKRLCPSRTQADPGPVWRLTAKGERRAR